MPDILSNIVAATSLPVAYVDPILEDSNDGCFVYDLGFAKSFAGAPSQLVPAAPGTDPVSGDPVLDLGGNLDAAMVVGSGQVVDYQNRGFNYAQLTLGNSYVAIPAGFAAAIWAGSKQRFAVMAYERLPVAAKWPAVATVRPSLSWNSGVFTSAAVPELFVYGHLLASGSVNSIRMYRPYGSAAWDQFVFNLPDNTDTYCGRLAGIYFSRDENGSHAELRILKADGTTYRAVSGTTAAGSEQSQDFSALTGKWGLGNSGFWNSGGPINTSTYASRDRTLHRLALFDRNLDTRDLDPVFDEDWDRFVARANAGHFGAV